MAFKPSNARSTFASNDNEPRNFPTPKGGSRKARVSLIVDLGIQNRPDFEDPITKELKPQKPCHQVAVFADLVADTVDYGGTIGKQHYRMLLNKSFKGDVQGINFTAVPPRDADGNMIQGKPWGLHPANVLTKLAKAVGKPEVIESMDIEQLLDQPFMCQVEVKETEDKNGKKDKDGNVIVYKNVNFKGPAPVPEIEDEDGNSAPLPVAKLNAPARCVTFENATVEDIKLIRANLLKQIKLATNYAGSQMQKAIEEFEAANGGGDAAPAPAPKPAAKPAAAPKAPPKGFSDDEDFDDAPF